MFLLLLSSLAVGFVHTLLGPDHYVPFIVLAKARQWSLLKTTIITLLCGIGHVLSAAVLGVFAIAIGIALSKLEIIESFRGEVAAWLLIGFGFAYFIWGVRNAIRNKKHSHLHLHADGSAHIHDHGHSSEHTHVHLKKDLKELTPWILFVIFIFGPCEPLIPLIMYPAIQESMLNTILVTLFFSVGTLFTMLFMVLAAVYGTKKLGNVALFERYGNAMAGMIICGCGLAIKFLGV
jgi:nickel/cobalt transporter (NicO) family protein